MYKTGEFGMVTSELVGVMTQSLFAVGVTARALVICSDNRNKLRLGEEWNRTCYVCVDFGSSWDVVANIGLSYKFG
jgi:hypothetical protein